MKQFGSLLLAAVLGSVITIAASQWIEKKNGGVKIEHLTGVPSTKVAYKVNEKGEMVPLDFTATAEKK
jgi:serine protease Do